MNLNSLSLRSTQRGAVAATRFVFFALAAAGAAVVLTGCPPETPVVCDGGGGRDPDNCLGFRRSTAPVIDGALGDESWVNAFRYVLGDGNGTSVPHAVAQGMRTDDALFLSFEVNNDPTFDLDDAIVLAFDPTGDAANHRRIHIYPVFPAGAGVGGAPQAVDYWQNSTDANWSDATLPPDADPAWLADIKVTSDDSGSSKHWRVEIKIPIVAGPGDPGINLPSADDFGFYFSVLVVETENDVINLAAEESWPLGVDVGPFIENTPAPASWGNGILGLRTNGVSIAAIGTDQIPDHHIEIDEPNVFRADVENLMTDVDGNPVVANNVRVSFRLLNFGIPGTNPFDLIPTGNNPTPLHDVPAGNPGTFQFQTSPWVVPVDLRDDYLANPNQCLKADLETTGPNTLLINRSARRNTKFVDTASPFEEKAVVGTRNARPLPGERELDVLLREFRYNTEAKAPWTTELTGAVPIADRLWRLRALPGPDAPLGTVITPPEIAIPVERVVVPPGRPGQAQRIEVRPGNLITLVAEGSIKRGDLEVGPNGTDPRVRAETPAGAPSAPAQAPAAAEYREGGDGDGGGAQNGDGSKRYPLAAADSPEARIGALVGSFDGFAGSAFVVGRAVTIRVPAGAQALTLGTNDTEEGWQRQSGEGYRVEVIQTPADDIYRFTNSLLGKEPPRQVRRLPLGQNLPTWILCGLLRTPQTVTIHTRSYQRYDRMGCYSYAVKSIGRGDGGEEPIP